MSWINHRFDKRQWFFLSAAQAQLQSIARPSFFFYSDAASSFHLSVTVHVSFSLFFRVTAVYSISKLKVQCGFVDIFMIFMNFRDLRFISFE